MLISRKQLWRSKPFCNQLSLFIVALLSIFPIASSTNLAAISLKQTQATFCLFQHRLIKKKKNKKTKTNLEQLLRSFGLQLSSFHLALSYWNILQPLTFQVMHILFMPSLLSFFRCFLIILVSYSSIAIQIFFGKQPHRHCAKKKQRKKANQDIVYCHNCIFTANGAIDYFPNLLWSSTSTYSKDHFTSKNLSLIFSSFDFFLFHANPLINPNIRSSGFKRALFSFLYCISQTQPAHAFSLNEK